MPTIGPKFKDLLQGVDESLAEVHLDRIAAALERIADAAETLAEESEKEAVPPLMTVPSYPAWMNEPLVTATPIMTWPDTLP